MAFLVVRLVLLLLAGNLAGNAGRAGLVGPDEPRRSSGEWLWPAAAGPWILEALAALQAHVTGGSPRPAVV